MECPARGQADSVAEKKNECHVVAHDPLCSERLNQRRQCEELKKESWELKDEFRAKHDAKLLDKPSFARDKESWSRLWSTTAPRKSKWRISLREGRAADNGKDAATDRLLSKACRRFWLVATTEPSLTSRRWSEITWERVSLWRAMDRPKEIKKESAVARRTCVAT